MKNEKGQKDVLRLVLSQYLTSVPQFRIQFWVILGIIGWICSFFVGLLGNSKMTLKKWILILWPQFQRDIDKMHLLKKLSSFHTQNVKMLISAVQLSRFQNHWNVSLVHLWGCYFQTLVQKLRRPPISIDNFTPTQ